MFGPRVVGKEEAERTAKNRTDGAGGGAIQFGHRVLGTTTGTTTGTSALAAAPAVAPKKPATTANRPLTGAAKVAADKRAAAAAAVAAAAEPAFSEADVSAALADPTTWKAILRAESVRPEGVRPTVARLLLDVRDSLLEGDDMPDAIVAELEAVVGVAG